MCGLVGVARFEDWGIGYKDREVFTQMLIADTLRGTMGTGTFIVKSDGSEPRSLKIGADAFALLRDKSFADFFEPKTKGVYDAKAPKDIILIGHNRYKTTGNQTTEHAHPHREGNIILVHNGTIPSYTDLPKFKSFDVDSHALAYSIDKIGIDETIAKTHGSYAIIYFDMKEKTLNIIRNSDRPLSMGYDEKSKRVFFASEYKMLEWILHRNSLLADTGFRDVKENTLYTFSLTDPIPTTREIKGPKVAEFSRGPSSYIEQAEYDLIGAVARVESTRRMPVEMRKNVVKNAVKRLRRAGIPIKIIQDLKGIKKDDVITFKLTDYAEENPELESFIVMGENKHLPKTSIRFRLTGEKNLAALFETPEIKAVVRNLLEYPEGNDENDNYVIWVSEMEPVKELHNK